MLIVLCDACDNSKGVIDGYKIQVNCETYFSMAAHSTKGQSEEENGQT